MNTLVMKFGGTSTGGEEALNRAADIVHTHLDEWDQIIVVVSAMQGVTDMLLECAEFARRGEQAQVQVAIKHLHNKLDSIVGAIFPRDVKLHELINSRMAELTHVCQRIQDQGHAAPQELAQIAAMGERINVHVFSTALRAQGLSCRSIDAAELIITDDNFQSASPIKSLTNERIKTHLAPLLAEDIIPVVTGFIGSTISGETTTLGRGGSDYTAAILAESLGADEIWIWTDVDGVMTADPGLISGARLIPEISYNEVFQLAYSGAEVLHPKTILPAKEANIPIYVKNTFNPGCSGTKIGQCSSTTDRAVSALTGRFDVKTITFKVKPGQDIKRIKSSILTTLKRQGFSTLGIFQSKYDRSISFAISKDDGDRVINAIRDSWKLKSFDRAFSQAQVTGNLTLITIIGKDIYLSPQAMSKVSNTLEEAGVEIKQIGNGASPDALALAVQDQYGKLAIQQIHDRVILNGNSNSRPEPVLRHQPTI
jgi:aspartate kinase